jgi:hypothetical protein
VHFWLSKFLGEYRTSDLEEALKEAQIALNLQDEGRLPKQVIEQLIQKLKSKIEPVSVQ